MVGKSVEKLLRKLRSKKYRWEHKLFVAEGPKVVKDLIASGLKTEFIISSDPEWATELQVIMVDKKEFEKLSQLETAHEVLAAFHFPLFEKHQISEIVMVLDKISDPGNLGTIIRTCHWFGINQVFCVKGTADVYNTKCVQSTMGSIAGVKVTYGTEEEIASALEDHNLWIADMEGKSVFGITELPGKTALIMGSESHGPSEYWKKRAGTITIPGKEQSVMADSLNVAQAAAIILSRFFSLSS